MEDKLKQNIKNIKAILNNEYLAAFINHELIEKLSNVVKELNDVQESSLSDFIVDNQKFIQELLPH